MEDNFTKKNIFFIFHNSGITGASLVLLRYIQALAAGKKYRLQILLPSRGKIESALSKLGEVFIYGPPPVPESLLSRGLKKAGLKKNKVKQNADRVMEIIQRIRPDMVYCNTIVCAGFVQRIKAETAIPVTWHIHELELGVRLAGTDASGIIPLADHLIANSEATASFLLKHFNADKNKITVHYPALPEKKIIQHKPQPGKFVIGSSGTALSHKGAQLFVQLAAAINRKTPQNNFIFKWVGNHQTLKQELEYDIRNCGLEGKVIFTGELDNPFETYSEFDFFVSLSKEESFGLACMEAAATGIPVGGFEGTGGIEELIKKCDGLLVPYLDIDKMANSLIELSGNEMRLKEMGKKASALSTDFLPGKIIPAWMKSIEEALDENNPM